MIPGVSDETLQACLDIYAHGKPEDVRQRIREYMLNERGCPEVEVDALFTYWDSLDFRAEAEKVAKLFGVEAKKVAGRF